MPHDPRVGYRPRKDWGIAKSELGGKAGFGLKGVVYIAGPKGSCSEKRYYGGQGTDTLL
jgi:hypothetical protein